MHTIDASSAELFINGERVNLVGKVSYGAEVSGPWRREMLDTTKGNRKQRRANAARNRRARV